MGVLELAAWLLGRDDTPKEFGGREEVNKQIEDIVNNGSHSELGALLQGINEKDGMPPNPKDTP